MGSIHITLIQTYPMRGYRRARRALGRVAWVRSSYSLLNAIWQAACDNRRRSRASLNATFEKVSDPWDFAGPLGTRRHAAVLAYLERFCPRDADILEVGCAEGMFTERLATRCRSLLAVDTSPIALERARRRCAWGEHVRFAEWDLRTDPVSGTFDAVVAMDVLECIHAPNSLRTARQKLVASLRPGGGLFLTSTRQPLEPENAWWSRRLLRGRWINGFVGRHPSLERVSETLDEGYVASVFRKR